MIFAALLVWWLEWPAGGSGSPEYEFLDFYAGKGRLSQMAHGVGYSAVGFDIDYAAARPGKRAPMDLNSNAGMVWLGLTTYSTCLYQICLLWFGVG